RTVYAAEDPLVSIAEAAFHQTVDWQKWIGGGPLSAPPKLAPPLPLLTEHFLWCFTLREAPQVVDLEDPAALHAFHHRPHELLNPSSQDYHRTAMLADRIRHHPDPQRPAAGGILAPSVRTPASPGDISRQQIFFVPYDALAIPGALVRRWKLTIEFRDGAGRSVIAQTRDIDWSKPWFRPGGAHLPVPAYARRPDSHPLVQGTWYQVEVKFA